MSTSTYPLTFPATGPIVAAVKARSGDVRIDAVEGSDVVVDLRPSHGGAETLDIIERSTVAFEGGHLRIGIATPGLFRSVAGRDPGVDVFLTLPAGSVIRADSGSGDVELTGRYGDVDIDTGSGDVQVDHGADVHARTGSGDVRLRDVAAATVNCGSGGIHIESASGDVEAEAASGEVTVDRLGGAARLTTASGDVVLGELTGRVRAKTASGDFRVVRAVEGEIQARSASGDIDIAVVSGTAARLDCSTVSGRVRSELDEAGEPAATDRKLIVTTQSVSGSVTLTRTS